MMKNTSNYKGVVVPMVTPVTKEGEIDVPAVARIVESFAQSGVAPLLMGTTGEGNSVSAAQGLQLLIGKKTKEEQSKIRFCFMKETRQRLGSFPNGYFVPFMNQGNIINPFLENQRVVSATHNRSLNYYQRGDIWELFAEVEKVDTIILSTDGFVERILKNRLATPKMLLNCIKGPTHLKQFAKKLRKVEISSLSNKETIAMKLLNGCKKNTGSADDATALLGYMRVNKHRAFLARQNRLPAIKERD